MEFDLEDWLADQVITLFEPIGLALTKRKAQPGEDLTGATVLIVHAGRNPAMFDRWAISGVAQSAAQPPNAIPADARPSAAAPMGLSATTSSNSFVAATQPAGMVRSLEQGSAAYTNIVPGPSTQSEPGRHLPT